MSRPPLLGRALLRLLLPPRVRDDVAGDLEEEWSLRPDRRQFWRLALRSIYDAHTQRRAGDAPRRSEVHMHGIWHDVRYAARAMRRSPAFSIAAICTLALGIGANTAVFGIVNVLAIKPLPYADPSRVVFVLGIDTRTGNLRFGLRLADYADLRDGVASLADVAAYAYLSANLTGGDIPERVQAYRVTPNTFDLLGVPAALGRTFTPGDGTPGATRIVVISDGLWKRRFAADPDIVGRSVVLNGTPHEVVGVMPASFEFPIFNFKGDAWVPWQVDPTAARADRAGSGGATVVARLAPGTTLPRVTAEVDAVMRRLAADHPATNRAVGGRVVEMGRLDDEQAGPGIVLALGAVALVLLLACANVANLLLARGLSRSRELAVRAAVGATRARIARQLVVESMLLAAVGAALGLALAVIGLDAIVAALPEMLVTTVPGITSLGVDGRTMAFTLAVALSASLLSGVLPAWRATRHGAQDGLREGAAAGGTKATRRLRSLLVVVEVTLATVLVIGAALLTRSYAVVRQVDPGFDPRGVLTLAMTLPADRYPDPESRVRFYDALLQRLAGIPGAGAAGLVNVLPFSTFQRTTQLTVAGREMPQPGQEPSASLRIATPDYFAAMQIPLLSGRVFERRDSPVSERVAIVNRSFAARYIGRADAVGARIKLGGAESTGPWLTIVGVIGDVHHWQLTQAPDPELYVPLPQATQTSMMMLALRTGGAPESLVGPVRAAVLAIDAQQPIYHVKPLTAMVDESLVAHTASTWVMGLFGSLALVLAVIGIYGVISYSVTQQMPEFGVRLALGATPRRLVTLVLRQSATLVLSGVVLGTAAAYVLAGSLHATLFGVTVTAPATYVFAVGVLLLSATVACLVPAARAASAGPLSALRSE